MREFSASELATIAEAVRVLPEVASCDLVRAESAPKESSDLLVHADVGHGAWRLRVHLGLWKPDALPQVWVEPPAPLLAHIGYSGLVCLDDGEGLSVSLDHPVAVVASVIKNSILLLQRTQQKHNARPHAELLDEMEGYWAGQHARLVHGVVRVDDQPRIVHAVIHAGGQQHQPDAFIEATQDAGPSYLAPLYGRKRVRLRSLYLPLEQPILPPAPMEALTADVVRDIRAAAGTRGRELLDAFGERHRNRRGWVYLILSQPRPKGGYRSLFGVGVELAGNGWGVDAANILSLQPLAFIRHDVQHVRERGGASEQLGPKHVVVIGCGALGSRIAELLAMAGVGHLTLVDPDALSPDNAYRHVLGALPTGFNKAEVLASSLSERLPGLKAEFFPGTMAAWEAKSRSVPIDLVLLAIGNPTVERLFVRRWRQQPYSPLAAVTWLEALGLGGHTVVFNSTGPGCLECLYRSLEGEEQLTPKTAYLAEGQRVSRNLTGCGGAFTPFSALDANRTANQTAALCIRALTSPSIVLPGYASWRGDHDTADAAGIAVSDWYSAAPRELEVFGREAPFNCRCPVCGAAPV